MPSITLPPDLISHCEVFIAHDGGSWNERLTIIKIEEIPNFTAPPLVKIYVKPPLSLVKE